MSWLDKLIGGGKSQGKTRAPTQSQVSLSDAYLQIDRQQHGLSDLGVRTLRVYPYDGDLIERQNFAFTLVLNLDGEETRIPGQGTVRQITPNEGLIAQFAAPQPFYDRKLIEFLARFKAGQGLTSPSRKRP
jgi:hypothetical protein